MFYNWRFEYDNDGHPVRIVFNNWNEQRDNTLGFPYAFCAGNHIFFQNLQTQINISRYDIK